MAKTIQMRTSQQEKEARLVAGMYDKNKKIQSELYVYCSRYFWANYRGVFFADEESATEIFQNTFIAMWENIERRKIYVSEGRVMGKNNEPLSSSILTYFMGIARIKYLEWVREHPSYADPETEMGRKSRKRDLMRSSTSICYTTRKTTRCSTSLLMSYHTCRSGAARY